MKVTNFKIDAAKLKTFAETPNTSPSWVDNISILGDKKDFDNQVKLFSEEAVSEK